MNKVFKVIWSEARNAYVVVSEIAKNHGSKSCSTKKLLTMLIATGVMTCASMAPAMAATNVDSNANVTVKKGATVTVAENATVTVGDNAIVLGKGASAVKDSVAIGSGASVVAGNNGSSGVALGNKAHAGYKGTSLGSSAISGREGTTLVGANTNSASLYTTVVGTDSVINSDGTTYKVSFMGIKKELNVQGAAATVVGSKNTVDNKNGKVYSGVANNVMGSANTIEGSNGVTIQGIGNKVTDAYKDMNIGIWEAYNIGKGDYSALAKKESGAVAVVGGANTVSKQTDSTVIGYDNKLTGDKEKGSQNVFMAGSHNELNNVSDSLVMGNKNAITGVSNVISFGYQNAITANNAVAIGNGASVSVEGGVALGVGSVADRANAVSVGSKGAERQIINVAAGVQDTDAVNVSQLKDVKAEAGKHTTVTDGTNITVTPEQAADGHMQYNVALKNDITLAGDDPDAFVSISGSRGTIWASGTVTAGSVAAGDVFMDGDTATVSGLSNKTTAYDGFATTGKAATEEQLKEVATEAGKHTTVTDGANITVTEGLNEDGGKKYNVALKNDILLSGDNDAFVSISGTNGSVWASSSVAAGNVIMDGTTATVSGLGNTTTAYDGFANGEGKAATEEQLKEISKVADNANQGWNLSTNGDAASKVAPGETVDFSGDKNISVSNNGKDVKVELNKDIDVNSVQTNSVQTNALNAKYNLSVGTANENGTVPFFVNSNGAFYAANGKLVVDKDGKLVAPEAELGKVTADEGVIGNVVLKDGVFYKNSALRDGELFIGDADGNYSQITTKGAKLGKVTIDEQGNIAGANHIQTNALNAKYNLSVGTANENGTVPFFVNSNGAFYAANGKLVVDKDGKLVAPEAELGKVTADEGVIGNVVLKDGVFYKNSALRDGELFIGDADGNYSQITTKGAKLGKVTVAADGKISGVAAGAITADSTDAVNGSQLHAVATEAGKHSKVVNGSNINVEETDVDGQKIYKVNLNKDIMVGDITGKYVSISGTNGTIEATGAIATKDRVYADKGAKLADIDVTGDKISNGASSIVLDGSNVKVNDKVTIDQNGNIAGVNSIQTNALNAKYNLSVGTANENGIMPFFVNSNGAFYGANNNFSVDKDGKVTATAGEIGNVVLQNGVYTGHSALRDGELFVGDASGNYSQITTKGAKLGKVTVAADGKISGVAAGAVTADSTDAVNGSQLHAVATEAGKHSKVVNGSNINVEETDVDGQKIYKVNLNKDIMLGDLTGKYVNISGTNGTIETTGYIATKDRVYADKGAKLADIDVTGDKISNGASSIVLDGSNVKVNDKVTIDQNGKISGVAAGEVSSTSTDAINGSQLYQTNENVAQNKADIAQNKADIAQNKADIAQNKADIAQNKADIAQNKADIAQNKADIAQNKADIAQNKADIAQNKTDIKNLDNRVTNVEELAKKHTTVTAGDNITVAETTNADGGKEYKVALNKDISVDSVKAGDTTITDKGLEIKDGPSVTKDGINAGNKKITGVAEGKADTDAVNYGQLKKTNERLDGVENQVVSNTNRINQLGSRVNKVGAGAAALAALHPMDFDPDDKLTFSAGYGNYGGENAAAIGAYYRPDEKVMFSVGGTVGNGENMVNAGVSFSLDRTNHVSNSRTAMAREILDLRAEVTELKAMVAKGGLGSIAEDKMKIFPDVAENHWAYEYVGKLAAAGIIEGYPDGNFSGDRMMSRYEFAAMLYRAMQKGAQLDSKIINEFAPEMGRIRVDRISGEDGDRDKIERVRVNAVKGERDHYGNKVAKKAAK